ncbi:eukaryotic translation initiation factor 2A-like [Amphiura filiformis]|uniref:eukaryotic translation initiation factor 2A-like n=1 Tax=Amphiura filiformis TaxID=82378 RepID=UPI003B2265EE
MALPSPQIALRGSEGVWMFRGPPETTDNFNFSRDGSPHCKVISYSSDGTHFAWCNGEGNVLVIRLPDYQLIMQLDRPRTSGLCFSPKSTMLATWEPYFVSKDQTAGTPNMHIWDLRTGQCMKSWMHKRHDNWKLQWTDDEKVAAYCAASEIQFFEDSNFDEVKQRLHLQRVTGCTLSPGNSPPNVAVYVPGVKGAPAFVRLYKYPRLGGPGAAVSNKSFYKADSAHILWNKRGSAALVVTSLDVDTTGGSYYGEQMLHFLDISGETSNVTLPKKGPVYSVEWSPNSKEFCVVYGFMPAKATLFNIKCEPVYDFGTGPRNCVYYNPQGNIICLAGFGNLRGNMEFWDRAKLQNISKPQSQDSTYFSWSPDGEHFVTATCSPRLRVGNGFRIWHYTGSLLYEQAVDSKQELYEVIWQPFPQGTFPEKKIVHPAGITSTAVQQEAKPSAYVPPHARDRPAGSLPKLREYEPPQGTATAPTEEQNLSKSALKNKKKREAKARAQQQQQQRPNTVDSRSQEQRDAVAVAAHILAPSGPQATVGGPPVEVEKKIKNLTKKLKAIEKLKQQQASGKTLESNQLEKLQGEAALLKELQQLQLS